jgi:hypothetical protein
MDNYYAPIVGAYGLCFLDAGWPTAQADPSFCGSAPGETGAVTSDGPGKGERKSKVCQDLLKCMHSSNCAGGVNAVVAPELGCYCGGTAQLTECVANTFMPTGPCKEQFLAGLESYQFGTAIQGEYDPCYATAAALELYTNCDFNCCAVECLGGPNPYADPADFCNAPSSGGTSGAAGTTGAGGRGGSSGSAGTTGAAGAAGTTGAGGHGGISGSAGTTGSAGTSGSAGTTGTGGRGGSSGSAGTGGSSGSAGTGGSSGTGGASGAGGLKNVHFDTDTTFWTGEPGTQVSRKAEDATAGAQSGSLDLALAGADPSVVLEAGVWQCLAVAAGAVYDVGVQVRIPGQVSSEGGLELWYFSTADCTGAAAGSYALPLSANASWKTLSDTVTIAAGVQSTRVRLVVLKPYLQTTADALFDNVVMNRH